MHDMIPFVLLSALTETEDSIALVTYLVATPGLRKTPYAYVGPQTRQSGAKILRTRRNEQYNWPTK